MMEFLSLILAIFSKAGGPEAIRRWSEDQLPGLREIHNRLTGPNDPTPKG